MKFVTDHIHPRHILHKPHKWFLAFIISPVHAAEMHYKRTYHLRFNHARKLFLFDMLLLLTAAVMFAATVFWYTYDPTVTDDVRLTIAAPSTRLISGEAIDVVVAYHNASDVTLRDVSLALNLPQHTPLLTPYPDGYDEHTRTISLADLAPDASGELTIRARFITTPNTPEDLVASLNYTQEGRQATERVLVRRVLTAAESAVHVLASGLPDIIAANANTNAEITLQNIGSYDIPVISVSSALAPNVTFVSDVATTSLPAGETYTFAGTIETGVVSGDVTTLSITPMVTYIDTPIVQHAQEHTVTVVQPDVSIAADWSNTQSVLIPGEQATLNLTITNTGDITLENLSATINLPTERIMVPSVRTIGRLTGGTLTITSGYHAGLASLDPGERITIPVPIQLRQNTASTPTTLTLQPRVSARAPGDGGIETASQVTSPPLRLGGWASPSARSWYYTAEGDQLGRGPLPPQVGKETRYWVTLRTQNGANDLHDVTLNATLPPGVRYTGKTSVSAGSDITFDETTRMISYTLTSLRAAGNLGVHMELAVTPTTADHGSYITLLRDITFAATDRQVSNDISITLDPVTTALQGDERGTARGTLVQ